MAVSAMWAEPTCSQSDATASLCCIILHYYTYVSQGSFSRAGAVYIKVCKYFNIYIYIYIIKSLVFIMPHIPPFAMCCAVLCAVRSDAVRYDCSEAIFSKTILAKFYMMIRCSMLQTTIILFYCYYLLLDLNDWR